jgi:hypothetical protein
MYDVKIVVQNLRLNRKREDIKFKNFLRKTKELSTLIQKHQEENRHMQKWTK